MFAVPVIGTVGTFQSFTTARMRFFTTGHCTVQPPRKQQATRLTLVARLLASLLCSLGLAQQSHAASEAAIFLVGDSAGVIHLTDNPLAQDARVQRISAFPAGAPMKTEAKPALAQRSSAEISAMRGYEALVQAAARIHKLDPALLHAVIGVESGYDERAVSTRGAQGLMQLLPPTARSYGVKNAFDPEQNVPAGAKHLRDLLNQFHGDTALALAAYNAGAAAVLKHGLRVPPYAETQAYVPKVLARWVALRTQATMRTP